MSEVTQACIELPLVLALTEMSPVEFTMVTQVAKLELLAECNNVPLEYKDAEMQCTPTLKFDHDPRVLYNEVPTLYPEGVNESTPL